MRDIRVLLIKHPELSKYFTKKKYLCEQNKQKYYEYIISDDGLCAINNKYKYNVHSSRFETKFGNELNDYLSELNYEIIQQYSVCNNKYRIDFYIPKLKLAVEYDENEHTYKKYFDNKRQIEIEKELKCNFIRISEDMSVGKALSLVAEYILKTA